MRFMLNRREFATTVSLATLALAAPGKAAGRIAGATQKPKRLAVGDTVGLVTFNGPVGSSTFEPYSLENFRRVVMTAAPAGELTPPSKKPNELVDRTNRIVRLAGGKASGRFVGGNLTMVHTLMGTPYEID